MCDKRLSRSSTHSVDRTLSRSNRHKAEACWLIPALLLPGLLCAGIIIHGFVAISPTVNNEVCSLGYSRCGNLSTCVAQEYVCDGIPHCENGADEDVLACTDNQGYVAVFLQMIMKSSYVPFNQCDLPDHPDQCLCYRSTAVGCYQGTLTEVPRRLSERTTNLILNDNKIKYLNDTSAFRGLFMLSRLYISNNGLQYIKPGVFDDLIQLQWLMLTDNELRQIEPGVLEPLISLKHLDLTGNLLTLQSPDTLYVPANVYNILLDHNLIQRLTKNTFRLVSGARVLLLAHNNISLIEEDALKPVKHLVEFDIQDNKLREMPYDTFEHNSRLTKLTLDYNPLDVTTVVEVLRHTQGLMSLGLKGIDLEGRQLGSITGMENLTYVYFKNHRYCRYAPMAHVCLPKEDGISSMTNLLQHSVHRICIWVIIVITIGGNMMVIICRYMWQEESSIHALFITHLCTADMMTGMFLLVIATYDNILRDEYNRHALWWVNSWACTAAGTLGVMAAEVSVLILAFIAFERYMSITFPFKPPLVNYKRARVVLLSIWISGCAIAILPLTSERVFGRFYSTNGVCYPLFIDAPFASGWQYSCFIVLGINCVALILVFFFYLGLFRSLHRVRMNSTIGTARTSLTRRLMAIVLVYFVCLVPIIITKIVVLCGGDLPNNLYAWLTVFVVPVNSAFNPLVYTIFTPYFCRQVRYYAKKRRESSISLTFSSKASSKSKNQTDV